MVLTIFLTLLGCTGGFVAAYICTHCCCCSSNSNSSSNSSSDSSNTAFKEHIKYLTNLAVKEWLRIDIENMQRQYVAIENAKSRGFERFNDFNFIEPEPETVDLISVKTAGDDELKRNVLALEEPKGQIRLETDRRQIEYDIQSYLKKGFSRI